MSKTARKRLPNRRHHELLDVVHGDFSYTAGIGRFADGSIAEIFLNIAGKAGTAVETAARDAAIVASLALQYGVPLDEIRRALTRNSNGAASGPLGALLDIFAGEGR